jgi:hypothetical protein
MKNILKSRLFIFILGGIIFGSITGVVAYTINASNVEYKPSWTKENGESINNVKEAIDELYNKTNNNITFYKKSNILTSNGINSTTENINIEDGKFIIVIASRTAEYVPITNVSIDNNNLLKIGETIDYTKQPGNGTYDDYKAGRGSSKLEIYYLNNNKNSDLTFSVASTNNNYNAVGILTIYKLN